MDDFSLISTSLIFNEFISVEKEDMMLLGAPVVRGKAQNIAIQQRTTDCSGNQLLEVVDSPLRAGLSKVLNVDLNDDQWLQASVPLGKGRLGICSARMPAPSAFLISAASKLALRQSILDDSINLLEEQSSRIH